MPDRFSDRHGYHGPEQEITVRDDAPEGLRFAIPLIAQDAGMVPTAMRRIGVVRANRLEPLCEIP